MFELQRYEPKYKKWIVIESNNNHVDYLILEAFKRYNYGRFRVVFSETGHIEYKFKIERTF